MRSEEKFPLRGVFVKVLFAQVINKIRFKVSKSYQTFIRTLFACYLAKSNNRSKEQEYSELLPKNDIIYQSDFQVVKVSQFIAQKLLNQLRLVRKTKYVSPNINVFI